jgi:hypothetical protein
MNSSVVAMEKTWQWVASVLDVAEGQLRQGQHFETQVCPRNATCMFIEHHA